ncbi:MAG: DUF1127 domain-containing protein [Alphaproteobacteria bacterium]|nr:DUF1127 domain-containing protein [Alphaproteobacteria bacterium]
MTRSLPAFFSLLTRWHENAQGRARLARLPEGALKDLGLSKASAWAEIQKPFWKA